MRRATNSLQLKLDAQDISGLPNGVQVMRKHFGHPSCQVCDAVRSVLPGWRT